MAKMGSKTPGNGIRKFVNYPKEKHFNSYEMIANNI